MNVRQLGQLLAAGQPITTKAQASAGFPVPNSSARVNADSLKWLGNHDPAVGQHVASSIQNGQLFGFGGAGDHQYSVPALLANGETFHPVLSFSQGQHSQDLHLAHVDMQGPKGDLQRWASAPEPSPAHDRFANIPPPPPLPGQTSAAQTNNRFANIPPPPPLPGQGSSALSNSRFANIPAPPPLPQRPSQSLDSRFANIPPPPMLSQRSSTAPSLASARFANIPPPPPLPGRTSAAQTNNRFANIPPPPPLPSQQTTQRTSSAVDNRFANIPPPPPLETRPSKLSMGTVQGHYNQARFDDHLVSTPEPMSPRESKVLPDIPRTSTPVSAHADDITLAPSASLTRRTAIRRNASEPNLRGRNAEGAPQRSHSEPAAQQAAPERDTSAIPDSLRPGRRPAGPRTNSAPGVMLSSQAEPASAMEARTRLSSLSAQQPPVAQHDVPEMLRPGRRHGTFPMQGNEPTSAMEARMRLSAATAASASQQTSQVQPAASASVMFTNVQPMQQIYRGEETGKVFGTKVKYLNDAERAAFKVTIKDGKVYDSAGQLFDTRNASTAFANNKGRAIFVMDAKGDMYVSNEQTKGKFHHSSFFGGRPVAAAGDVRIENGVMTAISRKSGHYRPTSAQLNQAVNHLRNQGVNGVFVDEDLS